MGGLIQYLKDTRAELRHVAWPTQTQTIVYTLLIAALSVGIAMYLGLFDFLFTTGLARLINSTPATTPAAQQATVASTTSSAPLTVSTTSLQIK